MPTIKDPAAAKAADRTEQSATQRAAHDDMGPMEMLSEEMNESGSPVPESDHNKWHGSQSQSQKSDAPDIYDAMRAETADFE